MFVSLQLIALAKCELEVVQSTRESLPRCDPQPNCKFPAAVIGAILSRLCKFLSYSTFVL